jgi:hypothetical protein
MNPPEQIDGNNCMEIIEDSVECVGYYSAPQYFEDYDLLDENEAPHPMSIVNMWQRIQTNS